MHSIRKWSNTILSPEVVLRTSCARIEVCAIWKQCTCASRDGQAAKVRTGTVPLIRHAKSERTTLVGP